MSISTWLYNNKASFSYVTHEDRGYLVCTGDVGSHTVYFVEDAESGDRAFPYPNHRIESEKDMDKVVKELINDLNSF